MSSFSSMIPILSLYTVMLSFKGFWPNAHLADTLLKLNLNQNSWFSLLPAHSLSILHHY